MSFEEYLKQNKLRASTIKNHLEDIQRFKKWSEKENINYRNTNYNELLKYIQAAQNRGVGKSSINIHLNSINKYFDYLIKEEVRKDNPAKELRLKNNHKKVFQHLLTQEELETIYTNYINRPQWKSKGEISKQAQKRNVVILGLMIYQGVQTNELKKIEKLHLNLLQGLIYIPSTGRSNNRILKLNARQIIPMQNYLSEQQKEQEKLFNCTRISDTISALNKTLKQLNDKVKNTKQIRVSVIMNWLKHYNIRQVQYMIGHKHISSTEKYKQEDLQDLETALKLFHPLK